jgi:hypothetical protein
MVVLLLLSIGFEEDAWELPTEVSLPHSRILGRYEIDAFFEDLLFKLLASASLGVSGIEDLDDHI